MTQYSITAQKRDSKKGSAQAARRDNMVPGVVYGKHQTPVSIALPYSETLRLYRNAGTSHIVMLELEGKKLMTIIRDLQVHPITSKLFHIDFMVLSAKEEVDIEVPVEYIGESFAIKNLGGVLNIAVDTITVRCLPSDIPEAFSVDISALQEMNDVITLAHLVYDKKKVEVMHMEDDAVLCSVSSATTADTETIEEPTETEVISKKPEEDDK